MGGLAAQQLLYPLGLGPEPATVLSPEFFANPAQDLSEIELLVDGGVAPCVLGNQRPGDLCRQHRAGEDAARRGVATHSSGNHGRALAEAGAAARGATAYVTLEPCAMCAAAISAARPPAAGRSG